jgi:hypothetical protein
VCCFNAAWLIPLYATAPTSASSSSSDGFLAISISNLASGSPRLVGTVVAAYITFGSAMVLLHREAGWFVRYRHKFLGRREPSNYSAYVSGIPAQYRSSAALAQYFRSCAGSAGAVLEAHVATNVPDLEAKVARRDVVVQRIEHTAALERKRGSGRKWSSGGESDNIASGGENQDDDEEEEGRRSSHHHSQNGSGRGGSRRLPAPASPSASSLVHHHYKLDRRRLFRLERVETISSLQRELRVLDRDIRHQTRAVLNSHDPRRGRFRRANASKNLGLAAGGGSGGGDAGSAAARSPSPAPPAPPGTGAGDGGDNGANADAAGAVTAGVGAAATGFLSRTRERLRTGTVDYDRGDAMDDELRRILEVPDDGGDGGGDPHAYDEEDPRAEEEDDDLEAGEEFEDDAEASGSGSFESYNPAELSSGGRDALDDDELLEVLDAPAAALPSAPPVAPRALHSSQSTLARYSSGGTGAAVDPIGTTTRFWHAPSGFAILGNSSHFSSLLSGRAVRRAQRPDAIVRPWHQSYCGSGFRRQQYQIFTVPCGRAQLSVWLPSAHLVFGRVRHRDGHGRRKQVWRCYCIRRNKLAGPRTRTASSRRLLCCQRVLRRSGASGGRRPARNCGRRDGASDVVLGSAGDGKRVQRQVVGSERRVRLGI